MPTKTCLKASALYHSSNNGLKFKYCTQEIGCNFYSKNLWIQIERF